MNALNSNGEKLRLAALKQFKILDTLPEQEFDEITLLASQICETPIAAISLIDEGRQWFKSQIGLTVNETPRDCAFCDFAIGGDDVFVVNDARQDRRFSANPSVVNDPQIRFYAGAPLITNDGHKIGTLCVIDQTPRRLSKSQKRALSALARTVMNMIEARNPKDLTILPKNKNLGSIFSRTEESLKSGFYFNRYLKPYLIATLIVVSFTLIKMFLGSVAQIESPYLLFICAILLASWRGGFGPGLYATFAGLLIVNHYFITPPDNLFAHDFKQNLLFLLFVAQGVFIAALCASRLHNEKLLYQAGSKLEDRVISRTAQLALANNELKQEIQERNLLQEDLRAARDVAVESARLKSEFLANMSHEIRTPMNGVIGMTGLLLETELDNEQQRFAQIIRTSGESLLTIINDILDFSKVEAGKLELETLDFNLRDTVESLVEMFSNRAREENNELAALIYSDVPLSLRGDAGRIRQILTNLVGNALKFTKRGDIVVRVKKVRETANGVQLNFSVTDTGEGISEEVQSKLFQPFTQSDASTTRRFGGTGLGLSISKRLVEMMNGEIGVESEPGKGSTFWFEITLEKQRPESAVVFKNPELLANHYKLSGRRVLIVNDNRMNREVLTHQTRAWKMEVAEADSGTEALDWLEKSAQPVDLVILELQMPEIDGLETARRIISKKVSKQMLPAIIIISSGGFKMNEQALRESGISAFLTKPYRQSDLLDAVGKSLAEYRKEEFNDEDIHITVIPQSPIALPNKEKLRRILIVEDNSVNQMVAQNLLKKFGYRADVAANGREALTALEVIPYDLILMDCQMPEMDGYEASREIRKRKWNSAQIPIIALTAHATDGEREKCLQAGMDDYLSKPIEKEGLRLTVAHWLTRAENRTTMQNSTENILTISEITDESKKDSFIPAVDFAALDEITDNDAQVRREVVEIYLEQTERSLSELEQAIAVNDGSKLYQVAHRTVGGSAICGMTAIVEPMRTLERLGKEGKAHEAAPFLAQAQQAFVEIDRECRKIL